MFTNTLILAGLLPLVVAVVAAVVARRLNALPQIAMASGVAFGYIAAQVGLKAQAGYGVAVRSIVAPLEAADWLPLLALVAWAVTLLVASGWRPARFVTVAFAITVPMRLLAGHARTAREWSPVEKLGYLSLLAALIGFVWLLLATEDEDQPSSGRLPCLVVVAVGVAAALTLSGSFIYGQLSGALAASLTGAALTCFLLPLPLGEGRGEGEFRSRRLSIPGFRGAAGVVACLLVGLIILGHFYAELTSTNSALLVAALLAASAPLPKRLAAHPAWLHIAARSLLCLVPLGVALGSLLGETSPYRTPAAADRRLAIIRLDFPD
jgi:hypothetical protein